MKKLNEVKLYRLITFTLPAVFQRVGSKEFAYCVDCENIVRMSCFGRKDAPTVHLLRAWLLGTEHLPRRICAIISAYQPLFVFAGELAVPPIFVT